ncbi:PAS domain S-box protein [Dolichospermum sp. UHCC 0259]|uniref:PAS domain S-box protein n=1 Tax=Dolichospermum sp. UHCC 0259 TaxID=2590010 RepID=UPI001445D27E|nr:PAS domain S-box protein [Dolichospermum sp. UHCC 0259]MTJ47232.1 PAS domain S-box protein [Dolichospermum sp. UHCC 0259]
MLSNLEAAIVQNPLVAGGEATVLSAVEQMSNLSRQEINEDNTSSTCVVIVSDGLKVLGILTQPDVMRLVTQQQPIAQLTLRQFWQQRSPSASLIISESDLKDLRNINDAIAYFESSQITHLAIVDAQDQLVGVLQHESLKRLRCSIIYEATASLLAIQQKIHERIAQGSPLSEVLGDLLLTMETYLRGSSCSITLCRDGRLSDVIAPSLPQDYAVALVKANLPIAEGVGSCGTAAFRRELVVVTDIEHDPLWQKDKAFVLCYGLQACSSMPIFASDRTLLGAFGIYYYEQKAPQAQELDWIAQAANIAGIAIERDRAVQALQQLNHELENRVQVRTEELQEREQFLQTVLDTFPLSVFWKDVNSVYLGCNQNFLDDAGLQTIAQIIGKTDYEMPWKETEADVYRADDRAVIESQTAKLGIVETQHQASGQTIWAETNKLPLRNLQGEVIGVLGTYQDISDRKAAEKALMLKQSHLAALMNNIPHLAWIKDEQSRVIAVNEPFAQAFGVSAEELVGKTAYDIFPADLAQAYHDDDAAVLQSGQRKVVVERSRKADGTLGWFETTKTPFRDDQLNIAGTVGIAANITDLKTLELSLKASERRYASLAAAAPVAIFRFDEPLNCVYVNERWSELSGRPIESALGHGWMESLHPDDSEQSIAEWTEYYANSNPESQIIHGSEGRHLRPDGSTTWCYIQVAKEFDDDGNVVGYIGTLTDITDRKNIELTLQESQTQFRRMTESVPGMIFRYVLHPDGRDELIYVSPQVQQIYELTPEAVRQDISCLWARIHKEDVPKMQRAVQDSAASLQPYFVEGRLLLPNERVKWIQVISQPDLQENGDIIWDGVVIDVSDRKNAEKKLQDLSKRLELAIESAQIGIWEFDFSNNRLFWDDRMLAIHGVSPEAFHGTYEDWSSRVHPDDLLKAQPNLSQEQVSYSTEFRIIRPDGAVRWIMVSSFSQRDLQGELLRIVGVNLDISDRKNTELALKDLSDRLEFALKGANIGIWEWQINEGRLLWDERMFSLYEVSPEEFSGKYEDWLQRVHPDDRDGVQQAELQAYQEDKECRVEFRIIRPDGTIRFIDSYVFNQYNAQGEIQKKVGLNIDITDRKQAQLQLQRINEELIKATRLKDEFLANMSHELRTPLNAILGMTEILQEEIFGDLNERQMQYLQTIEKSSNHLLVVCQAKNCEFERE